MRCRDLVPAIREHAAGALPSPALLGHLRECEACSSALEAERRLLAEVDAVVGHLCQADPSLALLVHARSLARARSFRRSRPSAVWVAAALLAFAVTLAIPHRTTPPIPEPSPPSDEPRTATEPSLGTAGDAQPRTALAPQAAAPPRPRVSRPAAAQVPLVPPGQDRALLRFAALMRTGAVEAPRGLVEPDSADLPLSPPPDLECTVLTVEPIGAVEASPEESR